jgi:hypothetical protein
MEIVLEREYRSDSTRSKLLIAGKAICETMEKPWKANKRYISCIPEGRYRLERRHHAKHGLHLGISLVLNREPISIYAAQSSLNELNGNIAPVTKAAAGRRCLYSRIAFDRLSSIVFPVLESGEKVELIIRSMPPNAMPNDGNNGNQQSDKSIDAK